MGWLVAALALALLQGTSAQTDKDLIGYWPFDEGTGVTARDQAGKNDLDLVGNPVWTKNASGYCLLFDGSLERPVYGERDSVLGYAGIMGCGTISVWARAVDGGPTQRARVAVLSEIQVGISDGHWSGLAYDGRVEYILGPPVVNDQWVHLALTWNEVFARFYVNGKEIVREEGQYLRYDTSGWVTTMWDNLYISFPRHGQMYKGYVDDWKMYKCALAPAEIAAEYEREKDKRAITAPNAKAATPSQK